MSRKAASERTVEALKIFRRPWRLRKIRSAEGPEGRSECCKRSDLAIFLQTGPGDPSDAIRKRRREAEGLYASPLEGSGGLDSAASAPEAEDFPRALRMRLPEAEFAPDDLRAPPRLLRRS